VLYFYYEKTGWCVGASLPVGIHIDVKDYVELEIDTGKPYAFHTEVVNFGAVHVLEITRLIPSD
jgi:hypothetical protein